MFGKIKTKITDAKNNEEEVRSSLKSKTILLYGSPNSGKTTLATIIGKKLAEQNKNKNVLIIYADDNLPVIPYIFPNDKIDEESSLGTLFTPIKITEDFLLENLTTFKGTKNLAIAGFLKGENYSMYPELYDELAENLFNIVNDVFDYIIIDGVSYFNSNLLTFKSFGFVDLTLKVYTQNLKDKSYLLSQDNFLKYLNVDLAKNKNVLNKVDSSILEVFNDFDYAVNYSEEVEENFKYGNLLKPIENKDFNNTVEDIIKEVF